MARTHSITDAGDSATQERHVRERRYYWLMGLRVVCILIAFMIPGWPKWIVIAAAALLPGIAVVLANQKNYKALPDDDEPELETDRAWLSDGRHDVVQGSLAEEDPAGAPPRA
ncbi:MAG: DUF3099 domain-containing protein [Propionibacteriales bacterium]|nr:DUF3099 domain-containing protein [Propionibacteriales bacterium]